MKKMIQIEEQIEKIEKVFCNKCGKELVISGGLVKEGVCSMEVIWGYFSNKDGQRHLFDLCEECYDDMIAEFLIPPVVIEN